MSFQCLLLIYRMLWMNTQSNRKITTEVLMAHVESVGKKESRNRKTPAMPCNVLQCFMLSYFPWGDLYFQCLRRGWNIQPHKIGWNAISPRVTYEIILRAKKKATLARWSIQGNATETSQRAQHNVLLKVLIHKKTLPPSRSPYVLSPFDCFKKDKNRQTRRINVWPCKLTLDKKGDFFVCVRPPFTARVNFSPFYHSFFA